MTEPTLFRCPACRALGRIDDEQASGQVSIICSECKWHGYFDDAENS